jgi:hypothetical protein
MVGLRFLSDFGAGEADLAKQISKLGYNDTPLFNAIQKAVTTTSAESWKGHSWRYETAPAGDASNAHIEGSVPAAATSADIGSSLNHYQIIKHTYGITGSMEGKVRSDGTNELANEGARAVINHRKTIEQMLFSTQTPVQGVKATTAGVAGGLQNWMTVNNTIDAAVATVAQPLTIKLLRNLLKINFLQGQRITHIYVSDIQKDALDDILSAKNMVNTLGATVLEGTNYTLIKNMAYAPNVKVVMSPYVAAGEIIAVNHSDIALVYQRLTKVEELGRTKDAIEKELISELTLRVNNPYAVSKLKNLAIA